MNIERSIRYVLDDKQWVVKLLIGALISVVPIVNLAAMGYLVRAIKNIIDGQETPLPEWSDFGEHFVKGLLVLVAVLVYLVPIWILSCPIWLVNNATGASGSARSGLAILGGCLGFLASLYGIVVDVVLPAAITKYAVADEFGAFFRFGAIFGYIGKNLGNYLIALLVTVLAMIAASLVGTIACVIGLAITMPFAALMSTHLFAQVYIQAEADGEIS